MHPTTALPAAKDSAALTLLPSAQEPPRPRLLVVDDEDGPRFSLKVIFQDDFDVELAEDGPTAIELAKARPFDVAVLDIRMGGMSGIEVLERLRFIDPAIQAVMMTAFETTDTMRQALRLQACDYLNKPFDVATMRAAVQKALERRSLASEVRTNGEELEKLQTDLHDLRLESEVNRSRGEIYASIIHDINGPLTVISGQLQVINQTVGDDGVLSGEDLELVKDRLKRITRQTTNCIEISRRYLGFLRRQGVDAARVWVNQILADVRELLQVHPSVRNHQLVIQPLPEDAAVPVHGTDLIQILLNLTINALQCSLQHHRVEIHGHLLGQPLDMELFKDGPEDRFINREGFNNTAPLLALAVQDNGPGIRSDVLPKIFEPYFTTQPRTQGTGLGLSIVNRLLRESRAGLHVHTKPGQGTVFTIYLPAFPASSAPDPRAEGNPR